MKILLIEDEKRAAAYLEQGLSEHGYTVERAHNGPDGLHAAATGDHDLVILDVMLPGVDGFAVLTALRTSKQTPVLMLTARGQTDDKVKGFELGADDYLVKPFHFSELQARVTALSRRHRDTPEVTSLTVHDLTLDLLSRTVRRRGQLIELQSKEFALLECLMRNAGRVVTRTMLLERVWNFNFEPNTTVVETHVSRLRAKIDKPFDTPLIHTVRNTGYTMHGPR